MVKELIVVLTQTFDRKPLATVENMPGLGVEMTPAQDCEARPMGKRSFLRTIRTYTLAE